MHIIYERTDAKGFGGNNLHKVYPISVVHVTIVEKKI